MNHSTRNLAFHPKSAANAPAQESQTAEQVEAILDLLRRGERFLVCSHARPDGDAIGSMLAMGMLLEQMGKQADLVTADRIPKIHHCLPGAAAIRKAQSVHGPYDAVILLECEGWSAPGCAGWSSSFSLTSITMPRAAPSPA
jgi:hypothetical protein